MQTESTISPPHSFTVEQAAYGKCSVHFYENVEKRETAEGDTLYTYDLYILEDVPYHGNLEKNIEENRAAWLRMAIDKEDAEPDYTDVQRLGQEITDQMLENIEQGQQVTELELMILGGGV